jgi:hypothetical protein
MNAQTQDGQVIEIQRLNTWKNAPTLANLKQDLQSAKPIHDEQVGKIEGWLDNLNVTGKAAFKSTTGGSQVQPKLIRKQAEWRYAALSEPFLSTSDLFNVKPKTWEDREAAMQNQLILNQQMNTSIDKVRFIDEYVRAAVDEGTVIVRCGWEFEEEEYQAEEPEIEFRVNPEFAEMHEYLAQLKVESPSQYATDVPDELKQAHDLAVEEGKPIEPVILGTKRVTKTRTVVNRPTAEVCNFRNVVLDPKAKGDITKAGFLVYTFESSISVLKKDKRYKNLDAVAASGASILSEPDAAPDGGDNTFNYEDKARKRFWVQEYWGFWDIHGTGKVVPFVASWVGNVMIRMEESPFVDKQIPFVVEQYLPVRQANYGESDGSLLEDNQKVAGAVTRGMIDIMAKSANGQTGIRRDMLDTTNRRKFDKGLDYEFNNNVDPRQGVFMHTYPEIPQSAQFMLNLQNFEAESLTGVKSFSQGVSGQSLGDVAAAVRGALDAASKRELGILRRLSNGIVKIGRKFISMNSQFLSDEEVVRITNTEFIKVRKDDLAGNFDLELSISTAEEDNNKAEQLAFMFQTIGPNGDPGMVKMILSDIARLRKMPDLAKKIEAYEPQPDPMQQKIQQLEIAKLEAEIAEIQARAMSLQSGAQLNMAKAGTEGVKAGNLQSDTDQKNLDFVEQETGVTQERAKELHGEQARAQGQLKMLEHSIETGEREKDRQHDLVKEYVKARNKVSK